MVQQTAVEWLVEQLRQLAHNPKTHLGIGDIRVAQGYLDDIGEQAKEIHKQESKNTYNAGYRDGESNQCFSNPTQFEDISKFNNAENYYNETFKK